MLKASMPPLTRSLMVLESREAILALAPLLAQLASRCDQPGALHWLPYFLDKAVLRRRLPKLVLLLRPEEHQSRSLTVDDLEAAALFFEYRVGGFRTGVVATGDAVGFNSVIAPPGQRAQAAAAASRALVERGAAVVLATYDCPGEPERRSLLAGWPGAVWASRRREVARMLPLQPTLDATLAQMGKSTRANLRRYRRRLEAQVPCEFVADAAAALAGADLEAMNRASLNPVPLVEFRRRVHAASELAGSFLCGLRAADGRWLALMGGWRQDGTTVLQWQMNSAGLEKLSIGTVVRSYFMEHEIARGADRLMLYGGTPHTMRSAFETQPVADLVVRRKSVRALALCAASRLVAGPNRLAPRGNFLAAALHDKELRWMSAGTPAERRPLLKPRQTESAA